MWSGINLKYSYEAQKQFALWLPKNQSFSRRDLGKPFHTCITVDGLVKGSSLGSVFNSHY